MRVEEGFVPTPPGKVWYRRVGGERARFAPLLLLHGGPGASHDYLENLEALASPEREVVFYDQLGCGKSDQPNDPALWTVELFVRELAQMRESLGLSRVHILGQSWGGMLAIEYMLTRPLGVVSLILSNTASSMPLWVAEANRLRAALPVDVNATLLEHERAGTTSSPEYAAAMMTFYDRHVCRVKPYPDFVARSFAQIGVVYNTMNGPSEFHVTGVIRDWDRTPRLGEIRAPTLVISGEFDESTPAINRVLHEGIAGSHWVMLKNCSHLSHVEDPQGYMGAVHDFLAQVEA
jgi:proline-specific peptidase